MVRRFGALLAVTVTSFRKVLSIVLSFVAFSKPFSVAYIYGGSLVLAGVYMNTLASSQRKHRDKDFRTIVVTILTMAQSRCLRAKGARSGVAHPTQV